MVAGKAQPSEHNLTITYLTQYMQNPKATCPATSGADFLNPEILISAFGFRTAFGIAQVAEDLDRNGRSWNDVLVDVARISKAHCQYMIVRWFFSGLQGATELAAPERKVLQTLAYLFALHTLEAEMSEFLISGYLSPAQGKLVKEQVLELIARIRPDAVALVDALALPDYYLASALGRYDGKVYQSLAEMVEREPLNHTIVVDGYENYIKPFVYAGLERKKESKL